MDIHVYAKLLVLLFKNVHIYYDLFMQLYLVKYV